MGVGIWVRKTCSYLSSCPVLHLQFERSMKTLNVSESGEIHLVLVQLELQTTETVTGTKRIISAYPHTVHSDLGGVMQKLG